MKGFLVSCQLLIHYFDNRMQFLNFIQPFVLIKMYIALQYFKKLYTLIKLCVSENRIKDQKLICRADDHNFAVFLYSRPSFHVILTQHIQFLQSIYKVFMAVHECMHPKSLQ